MGAAPVEPVRSCGGCGASIYQEHLDRGIAAYRAGKLLCRHCIADLERPAANPEEVAVTAAEPAAGKSGAGLATAGAGVAAEVALESLPLDAPHEAPAQRVSAVTVGPAVAAAAAAAKAQRAAQERQYRRPLNPAGRGATRVRTFHSKLADGPMGHLDDIINSWLDEHPEVEIKFATTTVGVWEGKHAEPHYIVTVYY